MPPSGTWRASRVFGRRRRRIGRYEAPTGFSLSIQIKSTADAERIFLELSRDGRVVMPLEKKFWAARFGMLVDRFGIPWLINCEGSEEPAGL